jgi:hypothetical protein
MGFKYRRWVELFEGVDVSDVVGRVNKFLEENEGVNVVSMSMSEDEDNRAVLLYCERVEHERESGERESEG